MQIDILGHASGRRIEISYTENDLDETLLNFLRKNAIPIASSCDGKGVCKKCVIQEDWMSCKLTLRDFIFRCPKKTVIVSYL